jgi:pimeloyl-ACP methyl ester carboxylesterase
MGSTTNVEASNKRGHRFLRWSGLLILLIVGLIIAGAIYESMAEASDLRNYPSPGQMVDVGGYRLHLHCTGTGSPTIVVDSGWGDFSAAWGWVQLDVAKTTRICTYDRAGMGWSEVSSEPRTAREYAKELHTLLTNAREHGPYILVGHSMGAHTMLVYAHDYPEEVSGMVLVDAQALPKADTVPIPAPKPGEGSVLVFLARIGVWRLFAGPLGAIQNLPPEEKGAYKAFSVTPRSVQTFLDEGRGISQGGADAKAVTSLGALPLIVLSRGKNQDADWAASQAGYVKLSTSSQQFFAEKSGHGIMIEQPAAAVASILKMVALVRQEAQKPR